MDRDPCQRLGASANDAESIKEHKDLLDYSLISNIQKAQNTLRDHIKKGVDYASSNLSL